MAASDASGLEPWKAEDFRRLLAMPGVFGYLSFPADTPEQVAGLLLARHAADEAEILTIGVDPAMRRQGHAAALLGAMMCRLGRAGVTACYLEVAEDNAPASAFYRRFGFLPVGVRPNYYRGKAGGVAARVLCRNL